MSRVIRALTILAIVAVSVSSARAQEHGCKVLDDLWANAGDVEGLVTVVPWASGERLALRVPDRT